MDPKQAPSPAKPPPPFVLLADRCDDSCLESENSDDKSQGRQERMLPYNRSLDGLRGFAILLVLMHHMSVPLDKTSVGSWLYANVANVGWAGVDLFFVLSGYLIGTILLKSYGQPQWLGNFIARRALRVLPLYFVVIFVSFNLLPLLPSGGLQWLRDLQAGQWWYWLHLANFRVIAGTVDASLPPVHWFSTYWSLSIEEQFYITWPFVLLLAGPNRIGRIAFYGIVVCNSARVVIACGQLPDAFIYNNTLTRMDGLLLGTLLAWLSLYRPEHLRGSQRFVLGLLGLGVLAFAVPMLFGYVGGGRRTQYGLMVLYAASVAISGAIVWHLITQSDVTRLRRFFASNVLVTLGKYSYAIYVFNKPILYGLAMLWKPLWPSMPAWGAVLCLCGSSLVCLTAAWLSWNLIEQPFLKLKKYFRYQREKDTQKPPTGTGAWKSERPEIEGLANASSK